MLWSSTSQTNRLFSMESNQFNSFEIYDNDIGEVPNLLCWIRQDRGVSAGCQDRGNFVDPTAIRHVVPAGVPQHFQKTFLRASPHHHDHKRIAKRYHRQEWLQNVPRKYHLHILPVRSTSRLDPLCTWAINKKKANNAYESLLKEVPRSQRDLFAKLVIWEQGKG